MGGGRKSQLCQNVLYITSTCFKGRLTTQIKSLITVQGSGE